VSSAIEWILLGVGSCAAIVLGVRRHRPARVAPWLLLGGSLACLAIGDVFYAFAEKDAAEVFYLAMYVLVAASLLQFTGGGSVLVDRARLIDLLAWTCSTLLVVWVFVIGGNGQIGQISAAYVIGALVLVGVAVKLKLASDRNVSAALLLLGAVSMLVSDVVYPLAPGPLTETGYVVLYVTWGLAAVHPSMTRLTQPTPPRPEPWRARWAALLAASVATPPTVLLIEALSGTVEDGVVIAVAGAVTLLLAITRLADAINQNSQAATRERVLRTANTDLVSAADEAAVDEAVRAAVAQLLPAQTINEVVLATDDRHLAMAALPPAPTGPRRRSWWLDETDPEADGPIPHPRRRRSLRRSAKHTGQSGGGRSEQPGPAVEGTLICPLWLEPLAVARPNGGALVLTGRRDALTVARDTLEVLAGQAALALDRISLVEAVGRRDSDLYLRAVIRNTAELMLVVDEDRRIRYASPAVHELLGGGDLSPLATFDDLVHPDDRGQVRRALSAEGDGTLFCSLFRPDDSQVLVEATYRDLRGDRLVQGFVVTMRAVTDAQDPVDQHPHRDHIDDLPAWVNRRSAQHKFRY